MTAKEQTNLIYIVIAIVIIGGLIYFFTKKAPADTNTTNSPSNSGTYTLLQNGTNTVIPLNSSALATLTDYLQNIDNGQTSAQKLAALQSVAQSDNAYWSPPLPTTPPGKGGSSSSSSSSSASSVGSTIQTIETVAAFL